ncbi:MAG: hypothetical protein N5P05_004592 [Chroococcopsis gigantea SAG 12.99]|nr:hypothetical protein [Chroococcopsis gigantea SAG 12.99]
MDELNATKQALKTAIDETLAKIADYHRIIESLNLPELPPEITDFGENSRLYNAVIQSIEGIEETIG